MMEAQEKMVCPRRWLPAESDKPDAWREDNTCSFCGSLHPDEFLRRVEAGEVLTPTDKSYKVYLGQSKFYFQHFTSNQKQRFIELLNQQRVQFAEPGHFYVLPYFICTRPKSDGTPT